VRSGPELIFRPEGGREMPLLVWRPARPLRAISSAPLGGGIGVRGWVINATVPMSYRRDDPEVHLAELAARLDLSGPGVGLLTGVDVAEVVTRSDTGVRVWATVGLGAPIWAAAPPPSGPPLPGAPAPPLSAASAPPPPAPRPSGSPAPPAPPPAAAHPVGRVGTVNIVALVPARLSDAALVNAVATVTEAKAQALRDLALAATGTATDAVTVLCPPDGPSEVYGGPRSRWGAPLARAVHEAVRAGGAVPVVPWSERPDR
jgi:adenosylcobinamide hydrolase